ncbi:MAG: PadR family transcriptional regulator [Acidimicrobiales bacterium]
MATDSDDLPARWLKGLIEACVLSILRTGPAYGYEIARRFEVLGLPKPKGGTLYPILARHERDGLVEPTWVEGDGGPGRKYYLLTPAGQRHVEMITHEWQRFGPRVSELLSVPVVRKEPA